MMTEWIYNLEEEEENEDGQIEALEFMDYKDQQLSGISTQASNYSQDWHFDDEGWLRCGTFNVRQGFNKNLADIIDIMENFQLDILAVQEIGFLQDPNHLLQRRAGIKMIHSRKEHAGVGILIRSDLLKYARTRLGDDNDGRLAAIMLEWNGIKVAVLSLYMPTGLDQAGTDSKEMELAIDLYARAMRFAANADHVILLGDLNETRAPIDRSNGKSARGRAISSVLTSDLRDAFRELHPQDPGYTRKGTNVKNRTVFSRLDYALVRGWSLVANQIRCVVPEVWPNISDHRPLLLAVRMDEWRQNMRKKDRMEAKEIPNLRLLDEPGEKQLAKDLATCLCDLTWIKSALENGSKEDLSDVVEIMNQTALEVASRVAGKTGRKPFQSKELQRLRRTQRALSALRAAVKLAVSQYPTAITQSEIWRKAKTRHWRYAHGLIGFPGDDLSDHGKWQRWLEAISAKISETRAEHRRRFKQMVREAQECNWDKSRTQVVRRMLAGQNDDKLTSVINPATNQLEVEPEKVKQVLVDHFHQTFNPKHQHSQERIERERPVWFKDMYRPLERIDESIYMPLMAPFNLEETASLLAECGRYAAPGPDKVSIGVWKIAAQHEQAVLALLTDYLNACLRLRALPAQAKVSEIIILIKKANEERRTNNIRPISLQAALAKLVTKALAKRLGRILVQHKVLHPAQEAFIPGGNTAKCIDALLDVWEQARHRKKACFNIFYDIAAAYDSVPHDMIVRSLERLRLPKEFIELIQDSLSDISSYVRTCWGNTATFPLTRSVRQGDPISPLLFVIVMDVLHCGLDRNPLYDSRRDGFRTANGDIIASKGYADDTWIVANSMEELERLHEWVLEFCKANGLKINGKKTELIGRRSDGSGMENDKLRVDGDLLQPRPLENPVRYLGVLVRLDGRWKEQIQAMTKRVLFYELCALKYKLKANQAVEFFNQYLMPKLEYCLRFVQVPTCTLKTWDKILSRCIARICKTTFRFKPEALATSAGLILPSKHYLVVRSSEMFFRLNSTSADGKSAQSRWQSAGLAVQNQPDDSIDDDQQSGRPNQRRVILRDNMNNRMVHNQACTNSIGWTVTRVKVHRRRGLAIRTSPPSQSQSLELVLQNNTRRIDCGPLQQPWIDNSPIPNQPVIIFTDGSQHANGTVSWAFVIANDWLLAKFTSIPDEQYLASSNIERKLVYRCGILPALDPEQLSVFNGELAAIFFALAAVPVNWSITFYVDAEAAINAVTTYRDRVSERKRLRAQAHPFLQVIYQFLVYHEQHNAPISFVHVASHTNLKTLPSAGNRLADMLAKRASVHQEGWQSGQLQRQVTTFPLEKGHAFVMLNNEHTYPVINDVRKESQRAVAQHCLQKWKQSKSQSKYSTAEARSAVNRLLQYRHNSDVHLLLRCITNILERGRSGRADLQCQQCSDGSLQTVEHILVVCPHLSAQRGDLLNNLWSIVEATGANGQAWSNTNRPTIHSPKEFMSSLIAKLPDAQHLDQEEPVRWLLGAVSDIRIGSTLRRSGMTLSSPDQRRAVARSLFLACWDWLRARCDERRLTRGAPDAFVS